MDEKIKETKLAILDRILANVNDKEKALSTETIVSFAGIVETFDKTEDFKKTPKSDPDAHYKYLEKLYARTSEVKPEEKKPEAETEKL